ncbi:MAG: alpha/beta hydrolase family protein [Acidimicrobiia bacterium]
MPRSGIEIDPRRPQSSRRRRWLTVAAAVLAVLVATGTLRQCTEDVVEHATIGHFYDVPTPLPARPPGTLIRSERLLGAPNGSVAWRVLYHSTDLRGHDIAVSGIVVAPDGPALRGGRPIVSWAHPTTGSARGCAPSAGLDPFLLVAGLHELVRAGYVVAATDYSGMGAAGPPSYLVGATEGHNVLDAARAARRLLGTRTSHELLLWGHSQGGQAALFAAQEAPSYAPGLRLRAVVAAAPAAELGRLLADHRDDASGVTIGSYALDAFRKVYGPTDPGARLDRLLTPVGVSVVPKIAPRCLLRDTAALHRIARPAVGHFFAVDPSTTEPWRSILAQNTPGDEPIRVPVLITQGEADHLVIPATTADFVARLCRAGEHVTFRRYPHIDHGLVGERTVPLLIPWFARARAGHPAAATCRTGTPRP